MRGLTYISLVVAGLTLAACGGGAPAVSGVPTTVSVTPAEGSDVMASSESDLIQNVGDRVFFRTNSSRLTNSARQVLDAQADWLLLNDSVYLRIEGHADERGTREYNLGLGARRANAVRSYLIQQGIDASRLDVISFGKDRPVSLCSLERCWSKNRRAVAIVR